MTDDATVTETERNISVLELIQQPSWNVAELRRIRHTVFADRAQHDELRAWLHEQPQDSLRKGLGYWVLGAYREAEPILQGHLHEPHVKAVLGECYCALGKAAKALELLGVPQDVEEAKAHAQATFRLAAGSGNGSDRLDALLQGPGMLEGTAWLPFLQGWKAERELRTDDAIQLYAQSHELDPDLEEATFHLARLLELKGGDDEALELYEDCLQRMPPNPALLVNLGVLYEDAGEYNQAEACFRTVLKGNPGNARARLFLSDVEASKNMAYDEDLERREDKRNAILRTPVTDFELSVRSRNCLAKMGIRTLGDLVQKTEAELLSYKNFGETSLMEIQQILNSKSLRLGMDQDELVSGQFSGSRQPLGDQSDPRNRPIAELELSVRSRRVVEMFKLRTIGDLCQKTEAELMACPNFGQTSLNEIKSKLDELGLALKG